MPVASTLRHFDDERVTVDATLGGVSLTKSKFMVTPPAKLARIYVESQPLRWFADGTAPTSTTGNTQNPTDTFDLEHVADMFNFRAIRTGGTSATIQVTYYR